VDVWRRQKCFDRFAQYLQNFVHFSNTRITTFWFYTIVNRDTKKIFCFLFDFSFIIRLNKNYTYKHPDQLTFGLLLQNIEKNYRKKKSKENDNN